MRGGCCGKICAGRVGGAGLKEQSCLGRTFVKGGVGELAPVRVGVSKDLHLVQTPVHGLKQAK